MHISCVTLFPEMFRAITEGGVVGRALDADHAQLSLVNPRDFTSDVHRTVDDRPYGGGPGMVMKAQPVIDAVNAAKEGMSGTSRVILMSPQGARLDHKKALGLAQLEGLVLVAGRYEGVDERVLEMGIDEELSIGDYVLSGGELAAMVVIDSIVRLLPGTLGDDRSASEDSFVDGLLDCPHYTRPETYEGKSVPAVLASGDHQKIQTWRLQQALGRTWQRRPDLLTARGLSKEEQRLLDEFIEQHGNR